jgi:PAS domain S-box-containing protein
MSEVHKKYHSGDSPTNEYIRDLENRLGEAEARIRALEKGQPPTAVLLKRQNQVTGAINQVLTEAIKSETEAQLAATCLAVAEELTGSRIGFIGEIGPDGLLLALAASHPHGFPGIQPGHDGKDTTVISFPIRGMHGRVLKTGKSLITNSPTDHPDYYGVPEGHLPLTAFLGVPLIDEGRTIGLIAVGNRDGGYRAEDQAALELLAPAIVEALKRTRAETALRENDERFRLMFEGHRAVMLLIEPTTGKIVDANEAAVAFYGHPREQLRTMRIDQINQLSPDEVAAQRQEALGLVKNRFIFPHRLADGRIRWVEVYSSPVTIQNRPMLFSIIHDITARRQTEEALRESEERYRNLFESIDEGFCIIKVLFDEQEKPVDYRFLEVNPAFERQTDIENATGKRMREIAPQLEDYWFEIYGKVALTGESIRFENTAKQLNRVYEVSAFRVGEPDEHNVAILFNDISERRRVEEELRKNRELLNAIIDNATAAIYAKDLSGHYILSNYYHSALLKRTPEQVLGKSETELAAHSPGLSEYLHNDNLVSERRQPIQFEETGLGSDNSVRTYLSVKFPLTKPDGSVYAVCGISTDITERKQAEQAITQYSERLEQLNRDLEIANQELKDFAYIASHDLQEPLRKVIKFGELLQQQYAVDLEDTGHEYIERMVDAATRMQKMINGLLDYSRISTHGDQFTRVDLVEITREVLSDLEVRLLQSQAKVELSDLPIIEADALQMRQLMLNLLVNALKFHKPEVPPEIKIWAEELTCGELQGDCIRLMVQDHGIGFDPKYLDKLFTPFIRLHGRSEFEGAGMGLAICRKITDRHGGEISAKSEPGIGSTFIVTLNKTQKQPGGRQ